MILYSQKDYIGKVKIKIDELIGEEISIKEQMKNGNIGSELYRLKKLIINDRISELSELNTRCNFQKYKKGLLLRINDNMNISSIAINYNQIDSVEIIKGEEDISPYLISPMKLLLMVGVHVRYARYFKINVSEYSIEPMVLRIKSGNDLMELDSSGWNYYSEKKYFENLINKESN